MNEATSEYKNPIPVKIVVAGGFAAGKTTFVGAISEISPLTTEAAMTDPGEIIDIRHHAPEKSSTTVAMDFGRITLDADLILYLFGAPGQERFEFMWDELSRGAIGAVILVDSNRLADCFGAVDHFERLSIPFVVAVNVFNKMIAHPLEDVREALAIPSEVPMVYCDARRRQSVKKVLLALVQHAVKRAMVTT